MGVFSQASAAATASAETRANALEGDLAARDEALSKVWADFAALGVSFQGAQETTGRLEKKLAAATVRKCLLCPSAGMARTPIQCLV